jgi:hypothetical protein
MNENRLEDILKSLQALNASRLGGWWFTSEMPNEVDEEITAIVKACNELDDESKTALRGRLTLEQKSLLLAFADRMASFAVRIKSLEPLMMAMMAMFLQIGIGDVREDILRLTLVHAAAQKIGVDPRFVFMESARQFGLEDTSGLEAYLRRSDKDKSLESMGYVEGDDAYGFRFLRTW